MSLANPYYKTSFEPKMQVYPSLSSGLSKLCVWGEHFSLVCYASLAIVVQWPLYHSVHLVLYFQGQLLGIFAAFPCCILALRTSSESWALAPQEKHNLFLKVVT